MKLIEATEATKFLTFFRTRCTSQNVTPSTSAALDGFGTSPSPVPTPKCRKSSHNYDTIGHRTHVKVIRKFLVCLPNFTSKPALALSSSDISKSGTEFRNLVPEKSRT